MSKKNQLIANTNNNFEASTTPAEEPNTNNANDLFCEVTNEQNRNNNYTPSGSPSLKCKNCNRINCFQSPNNNNSKNNCNDSVIESSIQFFTVDSSLNNNSSNTLLAIDQNNNNNGNNLMSSLINASNSSDCIQKNAASTLNVNSKNKQQSLSDLSEQLILNSSTNTNNNSHNNNNNAANFINRNICIIERLSYLYLNENLADVHFILFNSQLQQQERIPAHRLILSIGSQVFMAMFYGSGSHMQQSTEITMPDVEIDAFKLMLRYLYTDELYIEADTVMSTLYVAKKYAVTALEQECVDFLKTNLKAENAFMLLQQARLFDESQLAEMCLNLIDKNSCESFSSECFLDLDLETLILILKRDTLGIREYKLYYYLVRWAQNQCIKREIPSTRDNLKLVLGDAIKLIRFPLMTKEEFALVMSDQESRLIDDDSIVDLFVNLTLGNNNNTNSNNSITLPKQIKFNDTPRCCLGGKEQVINRFCQVESRWGYSGTSDRVRFSVNKRIFVVGFGLYGSIYGKCEYQVLIQLIRFDSCTTCAQNSTTFLCDGSNSTFRVLFKEPVEISPDTDYIAAATLKGPDSFYGTKGMRKVSHENVNVGKITFQFQYASGNNNGTSVEDGQIPEIMFLYSCS